MPGPKVTFDRRQVDAARKAWVQTQVPYATALAVNSIAQGLKSDLQASLASTFNNPSAYTLGAVFATKATKANPTATVGLKEKPTGGGTPAWKYLTPEALGGVRGLKRFEMAAGQNEYAVPGAGAQLNSSGDINRTQLGAVLSVLKQQPPTAVAVAKRLGRAAYKGAARTRSSFFVSRKNGVVRAVYEVKGKGQVAPVLIFTPNAPDYQARWDFRGVVAASIRKHRPGAFDRAMAQALATAK